jgi:predicted transcriptional regulator of viral defense system
MVAKSRRPIVCNAVRVGFIVRKNIISIHAQRFNTPRGTVLVSTPNATAIDLAGYHNHIGGLDQVAAIHGELLESLDPDKFVAAAQTASIRWAQRLGYLLERVEAGERARVLKAYVLQHARQTAVPLPTAAHREAVRDDDWKLAINADVGAEL